MNLLRFVVRLAAKHLGALLRALRFYSMSAPNPVETLLDTMEIEANGTADR